MALSGRLRAGLIICALLGAVDLVGLVGLASDDAPPGAVLIIGAVLGLVTLVGASRAFAAKRGGVTITAVSRVLSALLGVPAFFAPEAPDWAPPAVAVAILLTVLAIALIYAGRRQSKRA
jgi:O-antigen/teichoic acid export membrane protein